MHNLAPLQYMLAGSPLQVGTDFNLESRIVWYWLSRYGLRETRTRHLLRQLDAGCQSVEYDLHWLPDGPQLPLYTLRLLFPGYPIELFSAKLGARLFRAAVNPRASQHCLARRTFHWLSQIRDRQPDDAAPYVGLIVSGGRMAIDVLPVLHNFETEGEMRLQPLGEVLCLIDRSCPRPLWQASATSEGWAVPSPC